MVITAKHKQGAGKAALRLEDELHKSLEKYIQPYKPHSPTIVIESIERVNKELEKGHYFFSDLKKEGILLYDSGQFELQEGRQLTKKERKEIAEDYFEQWFVAGKEFLEGTEFYVQKNSFNRAAFLLHQATENLCNCALLVLTDYKPKLHDIKKLLELCSSQSQEFLSIFPKATTEEKICFELLREAYIGARYDKNYKITKEQLEYLICRVEKLRDVVAKVCKSRIEELA